MLRAAMFWVFFVFCSEAHSGDGTGLCVKGKFVRFLTKIRAWGGDVL